MNGGSWCSIAGLSSDIIGASLLAVEAIKLENIRKLAEGIRLRVGLPLKSPIIVIEGMDVEDLGIPDAELRAMGLGRRIWLYIAFHALAGLTGLAAVDLFAHAAFGQRPLVRIVTSAFAQNPWIAIPVAVLIGIPVVFAAGELVIHGVLAGSVKGVLGLLNFVDRKTPSGTTGLIGFAFMFCGFVGQMAGVVIDT